MTESVKSRCWRIMANLAPAYRRTGAKVTYVAHNFQEVRIELPLNWKTRNHMNMIWGGSLYGALDPVYGVMLLKLLGPAYTVVDKAATIRFQRPGRTTLAARFVVSDQELQWLRHNLNNHTKLDRRYQVELVDSAGNVCAVCDKTVNIRKNQQQPEQRIWVAGELDSGRAQKSLHGIAARPFQ